MFEKVNCPVVQSGGVVSATHALDLQIVPPVQSELVLHVVEQLVAPHAYGAHVVVVDAVHAPPPEQLAADVATPPVHEAVRHDVIEPGYVHADRVVPSHVPPQTLPSVAHAARLPTGLPVTALHVPALPPMLHASHCPVHAVSQQMPSTQFPDVHALAEEQVEPFATLAVQLPPLQKSPETQSASLAHVVRHEVVPHANGAQLVVLDAGHDPAPSQLADAVAAPDVHDALRHDVELLGYAHAVRSDPLQLPPHTDPSLVHAGRPPTGAPFTAVHVPAEPATLHDSHCPVHALLQHTPSVQLPDVHWFDATHAAPFDCFEAHAPALQ